MKKEIAELSQQHARLVSMTPDSLLAIGGNGLNASDVVTELAYAHGAWTQRKQSPMSVARSSFAALRLKNGQVLVTGGLTTGNKVLNDCELIGGRSARVPAMLVKRSAHSMCAAGDYVYVFGGMDDKNEVLASIERIKINESQQFVGKWEYMCEMPTASCNVGLAVTEHGHIAVMGGKTLTKELADVHMYDCRTLFRQVSRLAQADSFPGSVPHSCKKNHGGHLIVGRTHVHYSTNEWNAFSSYMRL